MYQMDGQYPCTAHAILVRSQSVCILAHVWANMAYTQCQSFIRVRFVANLKIETRFNSILFNFYFIASFYCFIWLCSLFFYANTFEFCTAWQGTSIEIEIALFKNECNSRKKIKRSLSPKIALQNLQNCDKKGNNLSNVELNNGQVKYNV